MDNIILKIFLLIIYTFIYYRSKIISTCNNLFFQMSYIITEYNGQYYQKKIYLGNWTSSKRHNNLKNHNIRYILCLNTKNKGNKTLDMYKRNNIIHKYINIKDSSSSNLSIYFDECYNFIDNAKGNVLVHCTYGVSRSGSIVIMYLMKKHNMSLQNALKFVRKNRYIVKPNSGFYKQLEQINKN